MKRNVALVLSSGGARGMAHIGVIDELQKRGYEITSVAGTSMGALIGGLYATGKLDVYKEWVCSLDKLDVFSLIDFTVNSSGIVKGHKIIKTMKKMIPDTNIEDLEIPFTAVATDILTEKEIIFTSGSLYEAIRASISIPSVFIPYQINNWQLIDGGVINPIPINRVKKNKGDLIVVVNLYSRNPSLKKKNITEVNTYNKEQSKYLKAIHNKIDNIIPKNKKDKVGYLNLLNKTSSLMIHRIADLILEQYHPDITIEIAHDTFGTYEFYHSNEIIEMGKEAAISALDKYEKNNVILAKKKFPNSNCHPEI